TGTPGNNHICITATIVTVMRKHLQYTITAKKTCGRPSYIPRRCPMTTFSTLIRGAAISGLIGVAAGAFGAHGLKNHVDPALLPIWHTAVLYQLIHTLAMLMLVGLAAHINDNALRWISRL